LVASSILASATKEKNHPLGGSFLWCRARPNLVRLCPYLTARGGAKLAQCFKAASHAEGVKGSESERRIASHICYTHPMRIAIYSDSHDQLAYLQQALAVASERGITRGLHLGDMCAPSILETMASSGIEWTCVPGNNDNAATLSKVTGAEYIPADFHELDIDGRNIFMTHYPEIARIAALSGRYDAAFHGHTHRAASELLGATLLANPGELCGRRYGNASFGIYDTKTNQFEIVWM
jgi:uncharacterized protein